MSYGSMFQSQHAKSQQVLIYLSILLFLSSAWLVHADIQLPSLISDHMVLQSGMRNPIWGQAAPGESITVTIGESQARAIADAAGDWEIRVGPFDAGGPHEMIISGTNSITIQDVWVGEVWVCSGQSNMQWSVRNSNDAETEIAEADYPMIRLFGVKHVTSNEPLTDTASAWNLCSPETIPGFSAVGYFFGRHLHQTRNVAVGLINSSWGGTPAEAWTRRSTLEADKTFKPIADRWEGILEKYPEAQKTYRAQLAQWEQAAELAKANGDPVPRKPGSPVGPKHPHRPGVLFNGMIAPLIPYGIKGAIWYQGESNAGRAYEYRKLFPVMIADWRNAWGQGDFPFLFVQLANFAAWPTPQPDDSTWAELREAQLMTLSLPQTGMAVTTDVGESYDIHPRNKQDVGNRLALAARAIAYGEEIVHSGPIYDSMEVEEKRIRIRFKHVGSGLAMSDKGPLKGFSIAGANGKFVWAKAQIDGDSVVVWNGWVPQPVAVRYAWSNDPVCNLQNAEGLPASPFRTDDWPGITADQPDPKASAAAVPRMAATYQLPQAQVQAVKATLEKLLALSEQEDLGPVSPSLIVEHALDLILKDFEANGAEGLLVEQLRNALTAGQE